MQEQPSQYPPNYQPQYNQQYPPQQPPQPPKKSHKGLWITLAIIFAVLLFSCIGISVAITNSAKGVVTNAIATTDTNSTTTSSSTIAKVGDRKSTRLNSSHQIISYAVFCLKKKKKTNNTHNVTP